MVEKTKKKTRFKLLFTSIHVVCSHILKKIVAGESSNANTLTTDTNPRVEKIGLLQRTKSELNEEYKDSLEMSVTDRGCVRNDDEIKGDQSEQDTVEQDSLETIVKFDANQTNDGTKQFFPFAQIGTNWSQDCAAQNSNECEFDSNTNQNVVENQSINTTNELQTNCTISTNQTVDNQSNDHDHDFRDLPGKSNKCLFCCCCLLFFG